MYLFVLSFMLISMGNGEVQKSCTSNAFFGTRVTVWTPIHLSLTRAVALKLMRATSNLGPDLRIARFCEYSPNWLISSSWALSCLLDRMDLNF